MGKTKSKEDINQWVPTDYETLCYQDGKLFIFQFDKVFSRPEYQKPTSEGEILAHPFTEEDMAALKNYNVFHIKRQLYEKQLGKICHVINYFINKFDVHKELPMAYLTTQYMLEKKKRFSADDLNAYIEFVYDTIFTPHIVEGIKNMVDKNYLDDIESGGKSYASNNGKKHLKSLEFTNRHVKILLCISSAIKIMTPVVFHYFGYNTMVVPKQSDTLFRFYERLFDIFGKGDPSQGIPDVNMYNKLYAYVENKVNQSSQTNATMFDQREIYGDDKYTVIKQFVKNVLISENMVKYDFGSNIIGFNKAVINLQLNFFIREQYERNLKEVTNIKNSDGLSGTDKMVMNMNKLDETTIILSDANIERTIKSLMYEDGEEITDDELDWMIHNHRANNVEIALVRLYFAPRFGSFRDLKVVSLRQYTYLLLILRNRLLRLWSYGKKSHDELAPHSTILPALLTGNSDGISNIKQIKSQKFDQAIRASSTYQSMIEGEYRYIIQINQTRLMDTIKAYTKYNMVYCDYLDKYKRNNTPITYDENKLADETLFLLRCIT